MKKSIFLLATVLLATSLAYSSEREMQKTHIKFQHANIRVSPDVFTYFAKNSHGVGEDKIKTSASSVYGGINIGYDYLKPKAIYFGTDCLLAIGRMKSSLYLKSMGWNIHKYNSTLLANFEQRGGYSITPTFSSNTLLTPFIGLGGYYMRPQYNSSSHYTHWLYGAGGLKISQHLFQSFILGISLKAIYSFAGVERTPTNNGHIKNNIIRNWGYELAMPISWNISSSEKWNIKLQPHLLNLSGNRLFGVRFQAIFHF